MTFRFSNDAGVTLSPVDAANLRGAARAGGHANAITVLDLPGEITFHAITVATADELVEALYSLTPRTEALQRLLRELKIEYHLNFVYRGFVSEPGAEAATEFAADSPRPLGVGNAIEIDGRTARVTEVRTGARGFDGELSCEWAG